VGSVTPALFDTNILIDCLSGVTAAEEEIASYRDRAISIITWIEVMAGVTPSRDMETRSLIALFRRIPLTQEIAERAVMVRQQMRLKLPDALIFASAQASGRLLITRNTKDFSSTHPLVRIPYRL
jgi:predicted nucleic acid-binding protein